MYYAYYGITAAASEGSANISYLGVLHPAGVAWGKRRIHLGGV